LAERRDERDLPEGRRRRRERGFAHRVLETAVKICRQGHRTEIRITSKPKTVSPLTDTFLLNTCISVDPCIAD